MVLGLIFSLHRQRVSTLLSADTEPKGVGWCYAEASAGAYGTYDERTRSRVEGSG